jgi:hypothetical protein
MPKIDLDQIEEREIVPGFHARFVHSENMTLAFWRVEAGATLPDHQHIHEQVANVLEGEFELSVDGENTSSGLVKRSRSPLTSPILAERSQPAAC